MCADRTYLQTETAQGIYVARGGRVLQVITIHQLGCQIALSTSMSGCGRHSTVSFVEKDPNEPEIAEHSSHRAIGRASYENIPLG
jgi:hypothetical protein